MSQKQGMLYNSMKLKKFEDLIREFPNVCAKPKELAKNNSIGLKYQI
jgi:hypothetical protein